MEISELLLQSASSTNANANPRVKMMELFVSDVIFFCSFFYDDKVMKWQMLLAITA